MDNARKAQLLRNIARDIHVHGHYREPRDSFGALFGITGRINASNS